MTDHDNVMIHSSAYSESTPSLPISSRMASTCSTGSTAVESDSSGSESTTRKRKRTHSQDGAGPEQEQTQTGDVKHSWKRDDTYYLEDGSCILLVQDILFNVHRTILSKDSSSFSTMFTLPQGNTVAEGRSDDNPIVLIGDTPDEFRHFLWALYALPFELMKLHSSSSNLAQLIDIARISNKYSFKGLETWALDAIQEFVNRKPSPILNSIPPPTSYTFSQDSTSTPQGGSTIESTAQLTRLIRLAQMCSHERLLTTMIGLLRQLMSSSLQYAYLAMTLADELDLRVLRGAAYLEVMQKSVVVKRGNFDIPKRTTAPQPILAFGGSNAAAAAPAPVTPASTTPRVGTGTKEGDIDEEGRLIVSPAQQLRLLSGYYRLTRTWERLRANPPHFEHSPTCGATWHQHGCTQSWIEFWKEKTRSDAVLALGLADVLGRLRQISKDYERWGSAAYMHHDCKMAARRSFLEVIKAIEDALPDYFSEGGDSDD